MYHGSWRSMMIRHRLWPFFVVVCSFVIPHVFGVRTLDNFICRCGWGTEYRESRKIVMNYDNTCKFSKAQDCFLPATFSSARICQSYDYCVCSLSVVVNGECTTWSPQTTTIYLFLALSSNLLVSSRESMAFICFIFLQENGKHTQYLLCVFSILCKIPFF